MQQIYRRTPIPKCDFNKVALQLYWNDTSAWVFSWKFAAYFQNTFSQEHLWGAASEQANLCTNAITHNVEKWSFILQQFCSVHTASFSFLTQKDWLLYWTHVYASKVCSEPCQISLNYNVWQKWLHSFLLSPSPLR